MPELGFLHNHPDFPALIRIVAGEMAIDPALVEKDYWIMHCLFGLQKLGLVFELKGGTSLSKGFGLIHRFSEDIDIRIEPPEGRDVKTGRNQDKPDHCQSRKDFYDWLAATITMDGIYDAKRDSAFDDGKYRSGGIRLYYKTIGGPLDGLKDGILLEVGFDDITPNMPRTISSWAYDYAAGKVPIIDNRAVAVPCYHSGYTLVEKLQTISTKYRQQQEAGAFPINFMRHYYDVFCLLQDADTLEFIGTPDYAAHKEKRFRTADNPIIAENEAFLLRDEKTRATYQAAYQATSALYYQSQPDFDAILAEIGKNLGAL
ncbi:MAG: nucleotidyl transferase AbiEii/AbiGii toxin family protein [Rhodospirillales bacterium]|nr:nucleotidyl transferase AbiEii/AbiGii toxin family protein [Rhodospirillales bacterium]